MAAVAQEPSPAPKTYTMSDQAYGFVNFVCADREGLKDFVVVDKAVGQLIAIDDCQTALIDDVLYGREAGDEYPNRASNMSFAGRFDNVRLIYNPEYKGFYKNTAIGIASDEGETVYYAIHALISESRYRNAEDGVSANNGVTAMCIDLSHKPGAAVNESMDRLINLFNGGQDFAPTEAIIKSTGMTVFVLPSEDTGVENTLRITGYERAGAPLSRSHNFFGRPALSAPSMSQDLSPFMEELSYGR
jgi:hypothetical protein